MKKLLVLLLATMLVVSSLVGCSQDNEVSEPVDTSTNTDVDTDDTDSTPEATEDTTEDLSGKTVTVGRWGGNDAETSAFNQMLADFTAETGIEVEERIYSDYNQELQAEIIGGTAPDVFYVDAYMAPFFINQGLVKELDPATFELDAFYQPLKDAFMLDDKYYAVSKDYSTLALYYNKKFVEASEIPTTLEELLGSDFLTDLQQTLPEGTIAMTYNQDLARNMFIAQADGVSVTKDGIYANLSDPSIVENLAIIYDAAALGKIKTPADLGLGWNGDAFGNEKTAIMLEGNWSLGFLQDNFPDVDFGTLEIPTYKGNQGTMVFTVGWAMNSATKSEDVAEAFIKYATGVEGMATWTTGAGVLPSREDVTAATNVEADPLKMPHIAGAAYATPWQKGTTMDTINVEYRNYIPSVVSGERTLEEALMVAEDEANKTIEANQ